MARIGHMEEVLNDGRKEFWGHIRTLHLDIDFRMIENPDKRSQSSPDYIIFTKSKFGRDTEVGNGWTKTPRGQGLGGEEFISLTFDDPSFDRSLNVAAFVEDEKHWVISWRRRQPKDDPNQTDGRGS